MGIAYVAVFLVHGMGIELSLRALQLKCFIRPEHLICKVNILVLLGGHTKWYNCLILFVTSKPY